MLSIRPAIASDVPLLAEYLLESTPGVMEWLYSDALPNRPVKMILEHLFTRFGCAMDFTNCWMAEIDGQTVGGMHIALGRAFSDCPVDLLIPLERRKASSPVAKLRTPEAMHVMLLYVDPERRSDGIGSVLMSEAETLAVRAGTEKMSLNVRGDNTRAIALYSRLGYTETMRAEIEMPSVYSGPLLHMTKQI